MSLVRRFGRWIRIAVCAGVVIVMGIGAAEWRRPARAKLANAAESRRITYDAGHEDAAPSVFDVGAVIGYIDSGLFTDVGAPSPPLDALARTPVPRVDAGPRVVDASRPSADAGRPVLRLPPATPSRLPPSLGGPEHEPPLPIGDSGSVGLGTSPPVQPPRPAVVER